jgi:hypothetical protein
MRLLLDECVPGRLRLALPAHQVSTVARMDARSNELKDLLPLVPPLEEVLVNLRRGHFIRVDPGTNEAP